MAVEQTLGIIKPDAVEQGFMGSIVEKCESRGLNCVAIKMKQLTVPEAQEFYKIHRDRPFFNELVSFMTRGPVFTMVLEGEDAVAKYREFMGATNPKDAKPGTIRYLHGTDVQENAVHGSDSLENAAKEVSYFFSASEIFSREPSERT